MRGGGVRVGPASSGHGVGLEQRPPRKCLLKPGLPSHLFHPVPLPSAGWRGWGCTDSADALTYGFQLLSTLLLCLSNLMFLPPVVLAIRSRYVLEAAVYTFTMFFSTVCGGVCVFHRVLIRGGGLEPTFPPQGLGMSTPSWYENVSSSLYSSAS